MKIVLISALTAILVVLVWKSINKKRTQTKVTYTDRAVGYSAGNDTVVSDNSPPKWGVNSGHFRTMTPNEDYDPIEWRKENAAIGWKAGIANKSEYPIRVVDKPKE